MKELFNEKRQQNQNSGSFAPNRIEILSRDSVRFQKSNVDPSLISYPSKSGGSIIMKDFDSNLSSRKKLRKPKSSNFNDWVIVPNMGETPKSFK